MKELIEPTPASVAFAAPDVDTGRYANTPSDALLPPKGVEVWVDHPAFSQCPLLRKALTATGCDLGMERRNGRSAAELDPIEDWLRGRTPIPEKEVKALLWLRKKAAKWDGIRNLPPIREK